MTCKDCSNIYQRLRQQEDTIVQLVHIIGATNQRLIDLDQRQLNSLHSTMREPSIPLAPST
ncbi:hypothetical protein [Halobacillus litoralis]|uniref:hypothetical protein n=1 Tax=Halobacillus litoralis TaxID=45668 RepID=UPI001CFE09AA|nr:hypothetical protein [Halobacillus litoralis]